MVRKPQQMLVNKLHTIHTALVLLVESKNCFSLIQAAKFSGLSAIYNFLTENKIMTSFMLILRKLENIRISGERKVIRVKEKKTEKQLVIYSQNKGWETGDINQHSHPAHLTVPHYHAW